MHAIRAENLSRNFGALRALDRLSFSVTAGEIFGLIGSDGAGKTTCMRLLAGIMEPSAGDAWVLERHTLRDADALKRDIGYMSQRFGLYADLTVLENIHFYADIYGIPRRQRTETIDRLLAFSNLAPFAKQLAGNLSGGMKQKLGLACALVHTPRVLLLDEPTNGVDPLSRREFWRILYQLLRQGVTIMISTAYLDEADRCHRVGLIHRGKLLACNTPDSLKQLMTGTTLEIRTDNPRRAAMLLRQNRPEMPVGVYGDRLHVQGGDAAQSGRAIAALLLGQGIAIQGIRPIDPSLEDVFVSVLGHE